MTDFLNPHEFEGLKVNHGSRELRLFQLNYLNSSELDLKIHLSLRGRLSQHFVLVH